MDEDLSGLKSALAKSKEKIEKQRNRIHHLEEENQRLQQAFDSLAQAIALRNPAPPCSS